MMELVKNVIVVENEDEIQEEEGKFFLKQIAWNDYGWMTKYKLYYKNKENNLGEIKVIGIVQDGRISYALSDEIDYHKIYMIAEESEVYKNLEETVKNEQMVHDFLKNMGDLTYHPDFY